MTQQAVPLNQLLDELRLALRRYQSRRRRRALYVVAFAGAATCAGVALGATYGHWFNSPQPFHAVTPFPIPAIGGHDLLTGREISNADFSGRAGFLLVWRNIEFCPPCKGELVGLEAFARANPKIPIVGLDLVDSRAVGSASLKQLHATSFPSISGPASMLLSLKLRGYPSILAFNTYGEVVAISAGFGGKTPSDVLAAELVRLKP